MDDTLSMIRDIEDLLIHTPDDMDLMQMRDSLKASLEQQSYNTTTQYTPGSLCCIPFTASLSSKTVLLPARILSPTFDLTGTTDILVLILTPLTEETVPCLSLTSTTTTTTTNNDNINCANQCPYSHGYRINMDWILPIETLDFNNYKHSSPVWYKSTISTDDDDDDDSSSTMDEHKGQVWQKGTLTSSSIDSTTGQRMWRVYDDKCNYHMVGENQVVPLVYLDSNDNTSLNESTAIHSGANDNIVDQPYEETSAIDINKSWGAWQSHTKGFGEKMMKKMGYIKGEGLGIGGQGRLDPVQAYQMGTHYSQDNRPGLGSLTKKKKTKATKTKATTKAGTSSMFDMMNSMFETDDFIEDDHEKVPLQQQQHKDRGGLGTIPKQQNQQQLWQLQEKMNRLIKEQQHGLAAVQRNKGTTMEREFQINLQNTTKQLNSIKKELTKVESRLTRAKNMENMINF